MALFKIAVQMVGSLGFILYGMKMMSDGIQKSANRGVHRALKLMTGNRFLAVLTGLIITALVQSSGATTVMTVSFVNAGLLTLEQAIGLIFGANIGTTVTAWLISLVGNFSLATLAVPCFGLGYFLQFFCKLKTENIAEAIMGFALLFLGLGLLTQAAPEITKEHLKFIEVFQMSGVRSVAIGMMLGLILTVVLHSSSGTTAVVIAMAQTKVIGWEFAAASVLGSNVGSTVDAILASLGARLSARRAAAVHVLFNVAGSIIALLFFRSSLALIDFFFPSGASENNIAFRISIYHTLFNVVNTLLAIGFVKQIADLVRFIIKPKKHESEETSSGTYVFSMQSTSLKDNLVTYVAMAEGEVIKMSNIVRDMFNLLQDVLNEHNRKDFRVIAKSLAEKEDYADQMQNALSEYLVDSMGLSLSENDRQKVRAMIGIVDNLENITDEIYEVGIYLMKKNPKLDKQIAREDIQKLVPYTKRVNEFIQFVHDHLTKHLTSEEFQRASNMEDTIDDMRAGLKDLARYRLESGASVRTELLYIDIVRHIERIGDFAYDISLILSNRK